MKTKFKEYIRESKYFEAVSEKALINNIFNYLIHFDLTLYNYDDDKISTSTYGTEVPSFTMSLYDNMKQVADHIAIGYKIKKFLFTNFIVYEKNKKEDEISYNIAVSVFKKLKLLITQYQEKNIDDLFKYYDDEFKLFKYLKTHYNMPDEWYEKYDYLNRADKSGLWDLKNESQSFKNWDIVLIDAEKISEEQPLFFNKPIKTTIAIVNIKYLTDDSCYMNVYDPYDGHVGKIWMNKNNIIRKIDIDEDIEFIITEHPHLFDILYDRFMTPEQQEKYKDFKRSKKSGLWSLNTSSGLWNMKNESIEKPNNYNYDEILDYIRSLGYEVEILHNLKDGIVILIDISDGSSSIYGNLPKIENKFNCEISYYNEFFNNKAVFKITPIDLKRQLKSGLWDLKTTSEAFNSEKIVNDAYGKWLEEIDKYKIWNQYVVKKFMKEHEMPIEVFDEIAELHCLYEHPYIFKKYLGIDIGIVNKDFRELVKKNVIKSLIKKFELDPNIYKDIKEYLKPKSINHPMFSRERSSGVAARYIGYVFKNAIKQTPEHVKRSDKSGLWDLKKESIEPQWKNDIKIYCLDIIKDVLKNKEFIIENLYHPLESRMYIRITLKADEIGEKLLELYIKDIIKNIKENPDIKDVLYIRTKKHKYSFKKIQYLLEVIPKNYVIRSDKVGLWDLRKESYRPTFEDQIIEYAFKDGYVANRFKKIEIIDGKFYEYTKTNTKIEILLSNIFFNNFPVHLNTTYKTVQDVLTNLVVIEANKKYNTEYFRRVFDRLPEWLKNREELKHFKRSIKAGLWDLKTESLNTSYINNAIKSMIVYATEYNTYLTYQEV